jgi:hypothetical protein
MGPQRLIKTNQMSILDIVFSSTMQFAAIGYEPSQLLQDQGADFLR